MLKDSLYTILNTTKAKNTIEVLIELNAQHNIFKGHFPAHAVLPGACILQIAKEILELSFNEKLQLVKAGEIKFLNMIEPNIPGAILFSIDYTAEKELPVNINAVISKNEIVCCKIKALFKRMEEVQIHV